MSTFPKYLRYVKSGIIALAFVFTSNSYASDRPVFPSGICAAEDSKDTLSLACTKAEAAYWKSLINVQLGWLQVTAPDKLAAIGEPDDTEITRIDAMYTRLLKEYAEVRSISSLFEKIGLELTLAKQTVVSYKNLFSFYSKALTK